jgi:hypothetical protein
MSVRKILAPAVLLVAGLLAANLLLDLPTSRLAFGQANKIQRFEYKIIAMPKVPSDDGMKEATDAFNKLGNEGWDLAASEGGFYYIFKRSK